MTYLLFFSAIGIGLFWKKSRLASIYMLSVMFVLSVYKYNCADVGIYQLEYRNILNGGKLTAKYIGSYWTMGLCTSLGLSFEQYLIVYYLLALLILYVALRKMTKNVNFVLSFYMIYSFGIDAIQMKTMLADSFMLFALSYLFEMKKEKISIKSKQLLIFCIASIFAVAIHPMVAFFIICEILFYFLNRKWFCRYIYVFALGIGSLIFTGLLSKIVKIIGKYIPIFDINYVSRYLERKTEWGWLLPLGGIVLIVLANIFINSNFHKEGKDEFEISYEIESFIYSICLLVPFLILDVTYNRLFRVYAILLYVSLSRRVSNKYIVTKKEVLQFISVVVVVAYLYLTDIQQVYDSTLGAILRYNSLLN